MGPSAINVPSFKHKEVESLSDDASSPGASIFHARTLLTFPSRAPSALFPPHPRAVYAPSGTKNNHDQGYQQRPIFSVRPPVAPYPPLPPHAPRPVFAPRGDKNKLINHDPSRRHDRQPSFISPPGHGTGSPVLDAPCPPPPPHPPRPFATRPTSRAVLDDPPRRPDLRLMGTQVQQQLSRPIDEDERNRLILAGRRLLHKSGGLVVRPTEELQKPIPPPHPRFPIPPPPPTATQTNKENIKASQKPDPDGLVFRRTD